MKYVPSLELAFRIAKVFGVPLEEVFQYNGNILCERHESVTPFQPLSPMPQ
jgi:DNA-binding XRE family transcriptional regulator